MKSVLVDGRYILERRLGEGGMGQVYQARHAQLGKVFALKVIAPAFADNEIARARFNQEAKLASEIAHPNIVSVIDYGEDPTVGAYMVMELVEGRPLIERQTMSTRRALDVLGQIADVLEHIHKAGIIHGDIKPDNILLTEEHDGGRRRDVVRLIDFGLAHHHGAPEEHVSATPHYCAPERAQGGPATASTDVYALGVLGFQLLAGSLPFDGTVVEVLMAHIHDEPPSIAVVRGEPVDPAIEALIHHAMAKDPGQRHATAAAFRYELNAVMDMLAISKRRHRTTGSMRPLNARDSTVQLLFESSVLPQAVIASDGVITIANAAFATLLGAEHADIEQTEVCQTALGESVPELLDVIRGVIEQGRPSELRARIETEDVAVELDIWIMPFASETVHVLVHADDQITEPQMRVVDLSY